ncbi:hypothetical protein Sjap_014228 [Stephania japonica]|uniref:Protein DETOXIFICATION n=1 Tax=Stephania japonica TaxID=461633 RepID=A0AAP0IZF7_9MAGN
MAIGISHSITIVRSQYEQIHSRFFSNSINPIFKSCTLGRKRNPSSSIRLRTASKSLPRKDFGAQTENSTFNSSKSSSVSDDSRFGDLISSFLHPLRNGFVADELGAEILSIALPAALALAADPIASLVDSAYVGHLGSIELAAVGVSISVFNLVSKLFNVPLLNITTSFVAEEQALESEENKVGLGDGGPSYVSVPESLKENKKMYPSISTSLALAAGIGIGETFALSVGSGFLMNIMGITVDSPMRLPAESFLTLRAFGAPAVVIALAAQGTFRGFMDTKTPLFATCIGNLLNAMLAPILIFLFGLGLDGAAISTVVSEYLIAFILLWELNSKVLLVPPNMVSMGVIRYLKSGMVLAIRNATYAIIPTYLDLDQSYLDNMTTSATREYNFLKNHIFAAMVGPIPMAGHQICLQVWLALSLLTDALAIAGQALLSSAFTVGDYKRADDVIHRVLQIGLVTGAALTLILCLGFEEFSHFFSSDAAVLEIAKSGVLFVAGSQPMNAIAFVIDGLYYGVSDFAYAAYSMLFIGMVSSLFLLAAAPTFGLAGVWTGLFLFMTLRVIAGISRGTSNRMFMYPGCVQELDHGKCFRLKIFTMRAEGNLKLDSSDAS